WDHALRAEDRAPLGPRSVALLRLKLGTASVSAVAMRLTLDAARDGLRNELAMHRVVREWLARDPAMRDPEALNARVYTELFLTPASDPWLGLRDADVWDAIERDDL
ncbi:MAG: hypothetical protein M3Y87_23160, partial [Myxococcota bacterium]|nr:hypothetical protein [Myxococcota bacterium]